MSNLWKRLMQPWLACLFAGAAMPFAFAPYNIWPISVASLIVLIIMIKESSPKHAFGRGFAFGVGFFGVGISWVYIAIRYFGNAAPILAVLLTLLLVLYLALFPALVSYCQRRFFKNHLVLIFPCLWVISEWLRGWLMTGFPWLFVGYSSMDSLGGFAPIGGIYLMSFLSVLIASLLANIKKRTLTYSIIIVAIYGAGFAGKFIPWTSPNHQQLTVSLLQGNIAKEFKWNPQKALQNIDSYIDLTEQNWDADFIVWPEGAFSLPQTYGSEIIKNLNESAKEHNTTVALGIPYVKGDQYFNSLLVIGNSSGMYSKRHLVPFGEFTPLSFALKPLMSWLHIPMSNYSRGKKHQPLIDVQGVKIAPFICYEIVYPALVNQDLPQAQILLTISEDAWYGESNAVDQHLQMAQMRSLESARYSLFAVNTGISAIIDQHGKVINSIALNKRGVIKNTVPAIDGITPWIVTGDTPWLLLMLVVVLWIAVFAA